MIGFLTNCIELILNPRFTIPVIVWVTVIGVGFFVFLDLEGKKSVEAERKKQEAEREKWKAEREKQAAEQVRKYEAKLKEQEQRELAANAEYPSLISKYYKKYGNYMFEVTDLVNEIMSFLQTKYKIKKSSQEIRYDLKQIRTQTEETTSSDKNSEGGIWLIADTPTSIHPVNEKIQIKHFVIRGNQIHFVWRDKTGNCRDFCLDLLKFHCETIENDDSIDWKQCKMYTVHFDTLLYLIIKALGCCYDISSCSLNDENARIQSKKYEIQLNPHFQPYGIKAQIGENSCCFFLNDSPITLEEAIRKLPDNELLGQLHSQPSTPPKVTNLPQRELNKDPNISSASPSSTPPQSQRRPSSTAQKKAPTKPPKAPSKPNLSIEEQLVNYLKAQPVQWDYPLRSNNEALKTICNIAVRSNGATATITDEVLENLELSIQKKRAKNPRLADHNAAMEGNILAMLYEYSYLMQMFHAIYTLDFDTTQVDIQKLWTLIQTDCNARIDNLAAEKRKNPAIQATLDKYRYDNQITKLRVLNDATGREMDYIISFIMDYGLLSVMNFLLGNTKLLLTLRAFPIDDVIAMMDSFITTDATIRFTAYSR